MDLLSILIGLALLGFSGFILWLFLKATLVVAWIGDNVSEPLIRAIATILVYLVCLILGPLLTIWIGLTLIWSILGAHTIADLVLPGLPWSKLFFFVFWSLFLLIWLHAFLPVTFQWNKTYISPLYPTLTKKFGYSIFSGPKFGEYIKLAQETLDRAPLERLRAEHYQDRGLFSMAVLPRRELLINLTIYWMLSLSGVITWALYSLSLWLK